MKRLGSRASRMSAEVLEPHESSFSGIPESKWHELLEKEENDLFILGIREDIVNSCLDLCYQSYLEKQTVEFTVHCAYLAWKKVIDIYYMFRDPGDMDDPSVLESWQADPEPEPSIIDSWGSECIKCVSPTEPAKTEKKPHEEPTVVEVQKPKLERMESSVFMSELFDLGERDYYFPESFSNSASFLSRKSIFTRTLSMPREFLPLIEPLVSSNKKGRECPFIERGSIGKKHQRSEIHKFGTK